MEGEPAGGRRPRTPSAAVRLAWFALGASYVLVLAGIALRLLVEPVGSYPFWLEVTVNAPVFVTLGALVASKRPDHSIGWLLLGIGLAMSLQLAAGNYAAAALPMGAIAAWIAEQLRLAGLGALVFVMLLFPTGRLPSRRWRTVGWLALIGLGALFVREGFVAGRGEYLIGYENPFGSAAITGLRDVLEVVELLFLLSVGGAILSLIVRFQRARDVERQQLKWFVYAAVLAATVLLVADLLVPRAMEHTLGSILWGAMPVSLAVAVAVAVLRYRLYDIDRLVNRTLVYGSLTLLLVLVYTAGVLVLGGLLDPGDDRSSVAVAASTLAVAALFQPARRRVQTMVDRRFSRARYDATRTVEAFNARLRDEIDLDTLTAELLAVVGRTVQPAAAALRLRTGLPGSVLAENGPEAVH